MTLHLLDERGTPLDRQAFTWRDLVDTPTSKLDDDAFTRVRIILMNGIEAFSLQSKHFAAWMDRDLREPLARIRRIEQHQQTAVNWMLPSDLSPLETTLAFEQVAIEVTASVAQHEPDPYFAQVYRFGLLEDFDHLYRFSALMDRMNGGDPNAILQSYSDVLPGRPTSVEHRDPGDDLRRPYDRNLADPLTKIHAQTITAAEKQTHDYYMTIGPMFACPLARQLYAEIASIEEQHVTQYGSLFDTEETLAERLLLTETVEIYNYYGCLESETNPRLKALWERCLEQELGHLHHLLGVLRKTMDRDPAEFLPRTLPAPIDFASHRAFVRETLKREVDLRAKGTEFVPSAQEGAASKEYRRHLNSEGSPSELVARGYRYRPGGELVADPRELMEQEVG
jgi:hypothetical protein